MELLANIGSFILCSFVIIKGQKLLSTVKVRHFGACAFFGFILWPSIILLMAKYMNVGFVLVGRNRPIADPAVTIEVSSKLIASGLVIFPVVYAAENILYIIRNRSNRVCKNQDE